jgi:tetratricopeptide (TPR) repeat protein
MASKPPALPAEQPSQPASPPPANIPFDRTAGLAASAVRLLQEANAALAQRNGPALQSRLTALMALAPSHPEVMRLRAAIAFAQGQLDEAIELLRRAVAARPYDAQTSVDLGNALARRGDIEGAIAAFRRSATLEPQRAAPLFGIAQLLEQTGDVERAIETLHEALRREPDNISVRNRLARALHFTGRIDDARAEYRRTLAQTPGAVMAWYGLSTLRTVRFDADDLASLQTQAAREDMREHERAPVLFALAKAFEDNERYEDAFHALTSANAARRRQLAWDAGKFSKNARAIEHAFAASSGAPDAVMGSATPLGDGIVFIVGMPRSGSTLIEQILAAHPDVATGGELDDVRDIIRDESERRESDFPAWVSSTADEDWRRLGQRYLDRIAHRRGTRRWFTDKALLNWRYIGALGAMLPGARFVDCRRDAVETCLGCYRQLFATELAFTYDLAELASFWRDYDRTMRLWRHRFPDRIYEVAHENLIVDPDTEIRHLLDFCGLPFDEACLRFHESSSAVRTASAAQVREPLRADTARAQHYGELLDPLRALLESRDAITL